MRFYDLGKETGRKRFHAKVDSVNDMINSLGEEAVEGKNSLKIKTSEAVYQFQIGFDKQNKIAIVKERSEVIDQ